jgi:hypothetical protein
MTRPRRIVREYARRSGPSAQWRRFSACLAASSVFPRSFGTTQSWGATTAGGGGGVAGGGGGALTTIEALPETPRRLTTTLPVPVFGAAVKVVEVPEAGVTAPRVVGLTDHVAPATDTAFP